MSSYVFRTRIILPDTTHKTMLTTMRIESKEKTIELQHPDTRIQLTLSGILSGGKADKLKTDELPELKKARYLVIKGGAYETSEAAMEAGRQCQHAFMLALTRMRMGADFGDVGVDLGERGPRSFATDAGLKMFGQRFDGQILNDEHGVMVYNADEPTRFLLSELKADLGKSPDELSRFLRLALECGPKFSDRELLAFELFGASFFQGSARARLLTLVMAIEALLEPKCRNQPALKHIQSLIEATETCSDLAPAERESLLMGLQRLCKESIGKTAREFIAQRLGKRRYHDKMPDKFFTLCYRLRGKVVHGRSMNIEDVTGELERLVSDLLCVRYLDLDNDMR